PGTPYVPRPVQRVLALRQRPPCKPSHDDPALVAQRLQIRMGRGPYRPTEGRQQHDRAALPQSAPLRRHLPPAAPVPDEVREKKRTQLVFYHFFMVSRSL